MWACCSRTFWRWPGTSALLLSSLLPLLGGCIATSKYVGLRTLYPLPPDAKVLVADIPFSSYLRTDYLFKLFRQRFESHGVPMAYAPNEEWALKARGIQNPLDTQQFGALQQLGYTHLLVARSAGQQEGSGGYFTPLEVAQSTMPYGGRIRNEMANASSKSRVSFTLFSLREKAPVCAGMVTTSLGSLAIREDDGGLIQTDLTTSQHATFVALKKGTRRLLSRSRRVP